MEQLFKCKYTGIIFDNVLDCNTSEYENGDRKKFLKLVEDFINTIEKKFKIQVKRETLQIYDKLENYYNDRNVHWRYLKFNYIINGKEKEYDKTSDSVGDGRWEWNVEDNLDALVDDFETEHLFKLRKSFKGKLRAEYEGDGGYYSNLVYYLGDKKLMDVVDSLMGKKIEIAVMSYKNYTRK